MATASDMEASTTSTTASIGKDNWGCWVCGGFDESRDCTYCCWGVGGRCTNRGSQMAITCWGCGLYAADEVLTEWRCIVPCGVISTTKNHRRSTITLVTWFPPAVYETIDGPEKYHEEHKCLMLPCGVYDKHIRSGDGSRADMEGTQTCFTHWVLGGNCYQESYRDGTATRGSCQTCAVGPLIIRRGRCCKAVPCSKSGSCCCCDMCGACACKDCGEVDKRPFQSVSYTLVPIGYLERTPVASEAPEPHVMGYHTIIRGPCGKYEN